ncbi:MAG: T9SS type A sorting domain-containing protein, partial [Candidatus Marinimicrobia bacterium]|nr:T9SS type A sorting domain-containing protein [Candidatus Neomarinimicrobiota bacterium]
PITTIMYDVPKESHVTLTVYDLMGRVVRKLVSDKITAGTHSIIWNGTDAHGQPVSSGMYLYQLKTDNFMKTKKLVLLK